MAKKVKDHKGNFFKNQLEMCEAYGIDFTVFSERRKRNWSLQSALETPMYYGTVIEDHEGNRYPSEKAMVKAYGLGWETYKGRRKRGWSLKDALTRPTTKSKNTEKVMELVKDLNAEEVEEALRLYKEKYGQFSTKRSNQYKPGTIPRPCKDHLGRKFSSAKEMCNFWGVSYTLYHNRVMDAWPTQYALTYPKKKSGAFEFVDHNGNVFSSIAKMCNFYDIGKWDFCDRMNDGWSLKDALTLPTSYPTLIAEGA